ncbi:hypothetical protein O181_033315 [Austropuccinia psidii MF-1]|uniref:Uncharacterized protein n=1 Tax=Austropuccinia psidii MF-1 TaxID=1389203 RepID=A0A9Q3H947_9BASI|nr:hypothetical protein [Austropuccinia psidii MF-1]
MVVTYLSFGGKDVVMTIVIMLFDSTLALNFTSDNRKPSGSFFLIGDLYSHVSTSKILPPIAFHRALREKIIPPNGVSTKQSGPSRSGWDTEYSNRITGVSNTKASQMIKDLIGFR